MSSEREGAVLPAEDLTRRLRALEAVSRSQGARVAQLEDALSIYGPPPRRNLNIPELTREQRNTVVVLIILAVVTAIPALIMRARHVDT